MAMDESILIQLYRARVVTLPSWPSLDRVAWDNRTFSPPPLQTGTGEQPLWVSEESRILDETRTADGYVQAIGEVLYLIFVPSGRGTKPADQLAKELVESLHAGQSLTGQGLTVSLEHAERRPWRESPRNQAWIFKTVASRWRCYTQVV